MPRAFRIAILTVSVVGLADSGRAQTPPEFDVASIRTTAHGRDANGFSQSSLGTSGPERFEAQNSSLDELIRYAWNLKEYQVAGPRWLNDDKASFDISAKFAPNTPESQVRLMVRALLAKRFHMISHTETKTVNLFELVADKAGAKLTPAGPDEPEGMGSGGGKMKVTHTTLADFAEYISSSMTRPVVDKSGIDGFFSFSLQYSLNDSGSSTLPSLPGAILQTLGLRLNPARGPVTMLVIENIDRAPTAN
jgi:uncharacterized protein (TIGR03435 family)